MTRKGFIIDTLKLKITREVNYDDTIFDDLYVKDVDASPKEGENILFAAFTFPIESKEQVQKALDELKAAKKVFDDLQAHIYYKVFPSLRKRV
jgi:hypothetical protein